MASLASLIQYLIAATFPLGQLWRLSFHDISFPIIDVLVVVFAVINLINSFRKKTLPKNRWFFAFLAFALISLTINLTTRQISPPKPLLYFIRLFALLSLFIFPPSMSQNFFNSFKICLVSIPIFGLVQYLLWPNLTYLNASNWDPHLNRLVGSFFDPTFIGLILLFSLITTYLDKNKSPTTRYLLLAVTYLALAFTYSRSSLLCLVIVSLMISRYQKKLLPFILTTLIVAITIIVLPKPYGEGTDLTRTSSIKAKIVNYREAIKVFSQSPLIGHGYNTLSQIRKVSPSSHAASGFDSSLLTILATTGLPGLIFFILGIKQEISTSTFLRRTLILITLIHSLFANSLLYPWILIYLIFSR